MPPPKPKPRKQLAQAAAVASKWAFGIPGQSEKQRAAALKNYESVQARIRETGGALTDVEMQIGKRHRAAREQRTATKALLPKPSRYKPGDPEYSTSARLDVRDIKRATKAFTGPEKTRGEAILKELERQGFSRPESEQQAQAQAKQLVKKLATSERAIFNRAKAEAIRKAKQPPPPPDKGWAGTTARGVDWLVPERVERTLRGAETATMGITPSALKAPMRNLKEITADVAMAVPVIAETIYNDFAGNTHLAIPKLAVEMIRGWGQGIEAATPLPADLRKTLSDVAHGRWDELSDDAKRDFHRMAEEWTQRPFTAALNLWPAASFGARAAEFPSLVRNIARANPNMSKAAVARAARKESYVPGAGTARLARGKPGKPGWKGGIPDRILRGKVVHPETGEVLREFPARARPPSRSAAGRKIQQRYDRWSASDGPLSPGRIPGLGRFTELHRASVALNKGRALESDRVRVGLLQQMEPIETYIRQSGLTNKAKNLLLARVGENRARLSETFWGPQGPSGLDPADTLRAVADDLKDIATNGGLDVPTNKLVAIDKEIRKVTSRLDSLGPSVNLGTGLWAAAANTMRQAGYSQAQIEMNLELASAVARAWAKREPGRNPNEWLSSEEGRNIADFQFGAPPDAAFNDSLFQVLYPGDADIARHPDNPYRGNRLAYDEQYAAHQARKAAGEIPQNAPFVFDPPYKTQYTLTPESGKSKQAIKAARDLDATTDLDGNMKPDADPEAYAKIKPLLPRDAETKPRVDGGEGEIHTGRTTLAMKEAELKSFFNALEPEAQDLFAQWYERVWDYVAYLYGDDVMRQMGDAFFASQAAQSPSGGIANLFRTAEDIANGKPMPTGKEQWLQRNIYKLMKGEHLGQDPSGLAAKLMDFMDSGLGMKMRTIMQGMSRLGPGVVDRWTWRSDGYYPKPDSKESGMISRRIGEDFQYDNFLSTNRGQAVAYEYSSRRLQALTNRLNQQGFGRRRDWTVDQVQALDWFATKKRWVEDGMTPKSAEGGSPLDMALDNTREFVFDGTPEEMMAAAAEIGAGVRIVSGKPIGAEPGPEGHIRFSVSKDGKTHAIVAGAGGSLDRLRMRLGETGQTVAMRYPGSQGGTQSQRSHQLDIPASRYEAVGDAVRQTLKKKDAPNLYRMGDDTLRIDFGHGTTALKRAEAVARALGEDPRKIQARYTESAGMPSDVLYDYRRLEKSIATAERERMKKGRERGPAEEDRIEMLESLKERLGISGGETPTDEQILDRANRIVSESRGKPETLYQRNAEGVAGAVQWMDTEGGRQTLYLAEHANPSTFAHELFGHAAHEMKREMPTEFAKVEKRYKKALEDWERVDHERFAREMERYLMTGKAPIPELQPVFTAMRAWMHTVYETIRALGRPINPETKRLFDRYFGKEPLDFTPPKRLRRGLPQPGDVAAIDTLVDETADLLMRGPDVLRQDPARRLRIAGNMKWLEQQVLPYVGQMDSALAAKVHDLFSEFDEVRSGSSIFSADERTLLKARGDLFTKRHAELEKIAGSLRAQPDHAVLAASRNVMDALDEPDLTLEEIRDAVGDLGHVSHEIRMRTQGDYERQKWMNRTVDDIERALDPTRKVDKDKRDAAQNAMREISEIMTGVYLDVFGEGLSPVARKNLEDTLRARDDVIPTRLRELGLLDEGTGHGAYVPHYSVFDKLFNTLRGPVRLPAAGRKRKTLTTKVRQDQMTFGKGPNKLVRYGTGELQVDPRALLSAFRQRMRFVETSLLRKQLYEMAPEIPRDPVTGAPRIPEGWYIINGTGKAVPKRLERWQDASPQERDELLASGQDFDSMLQTEGGTVKMLEEYRDSWLMKEEGGKLPSDWQDEGLRMLPPEVVETMVGKVFESTPGGFLGSLGGMVGTAGRVATIFSHPIGYLQANVAANGILLMLTQPTRAPRAVLEFFKTPGSLRAKHHALYETISSLTGDVQAGAGIPEFYVKSQTRMENLERGAASLTSKWAGTLGGIADHPLRVASWTGHARKYGYDDVDGWRELATSTDPEIVKVREIVSQRAREDMLDFNKLSPQEQRLTRVLFIWPFIRAAVAQPLWLMREYPARMTAMAGVANAQAAAYGDGDPLSMKERYEAVMPAGERSMFDLSDIPFAGGTVNMSPINPLGPFTEKAYEAYEITQDPKQIGRVAAGMINPAFAAFGQGSFGYGGMDWEKVLGSTVPGASYVMAVLSAKKRGAQKYNDRSSWFDYIRRRDLARIWPESVDPEKIREAGKEAEERLDVRPAWEKAHEEDLEAYDKIVAAAVKKGKRPPNTQEEAAIKKSINAYNALDQAEDKMKETTGKVDLDEYDKIKATYAVAYEFYPERAQTLPPLEDVLTWPEKSREEGVNDVHTLRMDIRRKIQGKRSKLMSRGRDLGVVKD